MLLIYAVCLSASGGLNILFSIIIEVILFASFIDNSSLNQNISKSIGMDGSGLGKRQKFEV
jgi:hypothetical protein